jgi:hypothetical protein
MFSIKSHLVIMENNNLTSSDKTQQSRSSDSCLYELDHSSKESMFKPCIDTIILSQTKPKNSNLIDAN